MTRYQEKPWIKFYNQDVEPNLNYEETFLFEFLERSAEKNPDKPALNFLGYKVSYSRMLDMVNRFAGFLKSKGIKKGDSVAILLPNTIPCVVAYYGVLKAGGINVMNNPLYTNKELKHQFNDSKAKILVTLDLLADRMIDLRSETSIKEIVYTSMGDYLPFPKNFLFPLVGKKKGLMADVKKADDVYKWKDIIKETPADTSKVDMSFEDVAMYQYTGGTTGVSKGVMLTHANLSKQVQQIEGWFVDENEDDDDGIMLGALPFFHIFGLSTAMNYAIYKGWEDVLVPKPQPEPLLETIRKFKPTFAPLVPTMYIGMLNHPDIDKTDMSCIEGCFSGSAPLPLEVIKEFEKKTGVIISEGFGMTESCPVTHTNPYKGKWKLGSIGLPIADTECKIVDLDNGESEVPVGESGELCVKGPQVMKGYHNNPDATKDTLRDGWLYTGDIAKMDEDGYFYIVDRKKDMILSGGYNVYPRDIDEALYEHPYVQEACAIGIPHPTRGEAIKAFVVKKEGKDITEEELIKYCSEKLAKYKLPTEIEFRDELPKTNVGKILRKDLREEESKKRRA